jgi:hypothetical protein
MGTWHIDKPVKPLQTTINNNTNMTYYVNQHTMMK